MHWPWRRAAPDAPSTAGAPPATSLREVRRDWAALPPIQRLAPAIEPVVDRRFDLALTSWVSPQTIEPVDRLTGIDPAVSLVSGLARPEPTVAPPARPRAEGTTWFPRPAATPQLLSFGATGTTEPATHRFVQRTLTVDGATGSSGEPRVPVVAGSDDTPAVGTRVPEPARDTARRPADLPAALDDPDTVPTPARVGEVPTSAARTPRPIGDLPPVTVQRLVPEPPGAVPATPRPAHRPGLGAPLPRAPEVKTQGTATREPVPRPAADATGGFAGIEPTGATTSSVPDAGMTGAPPALDGPVLVVQPMRSGIEPAGASDAPSGPARLAANAAVARPGTPTPARPRAWRAGEAIASPLLRREPPSPDGPTPAMAGTDSVRMEPLATQPIVRGWTDHESTTLDVPVLPFSRGEPAHRPPAELRVQRSADTVAHPRPFPASPAPPVTDAGTAAVLAGVAQRQADGSVRFFEPGSRRPPATDSAPATDVISRESDGTTVVSPTPVTSPPPSGPPAPQAAVPDLDELAQRLYGRIRTMLKRELLLDRERAGSLVRGPR